VRSPDSGRPAGSAPGDRRSTQEGDRAPFIRHPVSWAMDAIHGHCRCSSNFSGATRRATPSGWKPSARSTRFRRTVQANWRRPTAMATTSSRAWPWYIAPTATGMLDLRTYWQAFWHEPQRVAAGPRSSPLRWPPAGLEPGRLFMARAAGVGVPVGSKGLSRPRHQGKGSSERSAVTARSQAGWRASSSMGKPGARFRCSWPSFKTETASVSRERPDPPARRAACRLARRRVPVLESSIGQNAGTGQQRREIPSAPSRAEDRAGWN